MTVDVIAEMEQAPPEVEVIWFDGNKELRGRFKGGLLKRDIGGPVIA
jgi:hypothetical protein